MNDREEIELGCKKSYKKNSCHSHHYMHIINQALVRGLHTIQKYILTINL